MKEKKNYVFVNKIKYYREHFGIDQRTLSLYFKDMSTYKSISEDERKSGTNKGFTLKKMYQYVDAFKQISYEKSNGQYVLDLELEDLFYRVYID